MAKPDIEIVQATPFHLNEVLGWLKQEHREDGFGFWSNKAIIEDSQPVAELLVALRGGSTVGFSVGRYGEDIVCVRKDAQGEGIGSALFHYNLEQARADQVTALRVECSPHDSLRFWKKHGFEEYGQSRGFYENPLARLLLHYELDLPLVGSPCFVEIQFFPESVLYGGNAETQPYEVSRPEAVRDSDGTIHLRSRCIGFREWTNDGDLVIGISIDGKRVYLDKAKYDEARRLGVSRHQHTGDYYLDQIFPEETK